jgi:hypothetical protein
LDWCHDTYQTVTSSIGNMLSAKHQDQRKVNITLGQCANTFRLSDTRRSLIRRSRSGVWLDWANHAPASGASGLPGAGDLALLAGERKTLPLPGSDSFNADADICQCGRESRSRVSGMARYSSYPSCSEHPRSVGGQCFERTQFQRLRIPDAKLGTIAVYEVEGTPQSIVENCALLEEGTLHFPM